GLSRLPRRAGAAPPRADHRGRRARAPEPGYHPIGAAPAPGDAHRTGGPVAGRLRRPARPAVRRDLGAGARGPALRPAGRRRLRPGRAAAPIPTPEVRMPCRDLTLCLGLGMAAAGCAVGTRSPEAAQAAAPAVSAPVIDAQGKQIGTAALLQSRFGASLVLEKGACEPPGFASAGPHYNPEGRKHGTRNPEGPHAGDLPNLEVASDGTADATVP